MTEFTWHEVFKLSWVPYHPSANHSFLKSYVFWVWLAVEDPGLTVLPDTFQMHVTVLNFSTFHKTEFIWVVQPKQFSNLWKSAKEYHSSLAAFPSGRREGSSHTGTSQPVQCLTDIIQQYKFNSVQEWAQDHISIWLAKAYGFYTCYS